MMEIENQRVSLLDILNNPQHSTKKALRPPGSQPRIRPPKLNSKRKSSRHLFSTLPISLMNSENDHFSSLYDHSLNISYFDQCFEQIEKVGEGSFGEVYKVKDKETGQYYAIKISKVSFRGECDREEKINEVRNYECVPIHDNIVKLVNAWEQDDYVYLQMELGYTSLEQYSEDAMGLTEQQLWNVLLDMLLALKNLHEHNLIHLDVKLENIIISDSGTCKLGDFGLLINLKDSERLRNAIEGDAKYVAAELMEGKFTKAADVFSLGISMLELSSDLDLPPHGQLWHNLRYGIFPNDIIKDVPKELQNIIRRMMMRDFKRRPSVKTLMKHPRLKSMLKQRKDAKLRDEPPDGRLPTPATIRCSTPCPVPPDDAPCTPPNNGLRHPNNNSMACQTTPIAGYSIPVFGNIESSMNSSCGRESTYHSISSTPYLSPIPSHPKYSKNVFYSSAKKLDFVNDM